MTSRVAIQAEKRAMRDRDLRHKRAAHAHDQDNREKRQREEALLEATVVSTTSYIRI